MAPHTGKRGKARQEQIISAARKLFGEKGYDETTMEQIVKKAHTSIGNCYFYFPNKEALFIKVIQEINQDVTETATELLKKYSNVEAKVALLSFLVINLAANESKIFSHAFKHKVFIDYLFEYHISKIKSRYDDNPYIDSQQDPELVLTLIFGAAERLLEQFFKGYVDEEPVDLGIFFARWNLQALGFPELAADNAIDQLKQLIVGEKLGIKFSEKPRILTISELQ
ncbi:TetR/AcrR family transcriptional regulator [candidate division KSB1 bacterium]